MRAILACLLVLLCGAEARAHAVLLETLPADRGVAPAAPAAIVLRFNEVVQPIVVELRAAAATLVPSDVVMVDRDIHLVSRAPLGPGAYIVSYRVTSADSHPVAGSFLFAVGRAPAQWDTPAPDVAAYSGWNRAAILNRALFLTASFLATGGLLFAFVVYRENQPLRPLVMIAAWCGVLTAIVGIYLQGGVLLDATDATPWAAEIWRVGFASTRGLALSVAAIGLILCTLRRPAIAAIGIIAVIASFALSGHAATASPRWIAIPTLLLHVGVVAFWLGSFAPLLSALRMEHGRTLALFRRFSDTALIVVPQLLVAGTILAVLQIQRADLFFTSSYGLVLTAKLSLVGLLLVLAVCNRWILMPEMTDDAAGHVRRFRWAIRGEIGLGIAILFATAVLAQTVPPRALIDHETAVAAAAQGAQQTALIVTNDRKALLIVTPARPGRNAIRVRILSTDDRLVDPLEIAVDLSNPGAGIEPLHRALVSVGDGYFEYAGPDLSIGGRWVVRIDALISDFEKAIFETEILVK